MSAASTFFVSLLLPAIFALTATSTDDVFTIIDPDQIVEMEAVQDVVRELMMSLCCLIFFLIIALMMGFYVCFCCNILYFAREKANFRMPNVSGYLDAEKGRCAARDPNEKKASEDKK
ncbi:hypothetical protein L596_024203 [Steinernema carpocapsae]|uniref:Uncharacterized protein n=1 Tax=Steinernema carpocapsae TaxID=34508 RepID=A0A4U5MG23_STECR|nr:hypothetical protein L596_024203 [Steinernema carpocapsae]